MGKIELENRNVGVENITMYYRLEPGDATCYRFSFCNINLNYPINNIVAEGTGLSNEYILASINMPGGTGVCCIGKYALEVVEKEMPFLIDYTSRHGWNDVYSYTVKAVLLALSVLVFEPMAFDKAAAKMLQARGM